jgi:replication initiation protein RepC
MLIPGALVADGSRRGSVVPYMQHVSSTLSSQSGGRVSSAAYRYAQRQAEEFAGLEEGADRYRLLLLVKKIGRVAGFTPRLISLIDYYLAYTRDCDWEAGARPIVYQSLGRTALDLGVSERQVQKLEKALFDLGAITWNDSGNHRRYGQRDAETGRILYAFGVDLTPMAYLAVELEQKLAEKKLYDDAWLETKRQISAYRRLIRGLLAELVEQGADASSIHELESRYQQIAVQLRTHIDLTAMRALLARHISLHSDVAGFVGVGGGENPQPLQECNLPKETSSHSPPSEQKFAHYKSTTQEPSDKSDTGSRPGAGFQESVADGPVANDLALDSGIVHVTLGMAVAASSGRLRELLPSDPNWSDVIEAAYRLRPKLGISQASWGEGCQQLGRSGAALCLLVTDRATDREENAVRQPAAYFRSLVNRAGRGELRLHNSVFGLLQGANGGSIAV